MIDVINLQKKVPVDVAGIRSFCGLAAVSVLEADQRTFSVAFISDRRMKKLNQMFRAEASTTDVLSFPNEPDEFNSPELTTHQSPLATAFLGDIVISAEQAQKQAAENGLDLDTEIKQLILHGLLHLCGYDHETDTGQMDARELQLRDELGIR